MLQKKKEHPAEKVNIHPRNKHRERYNFKELIHSFPGLAPFVRLNEFDDESVDFFNPEAVLMLNKALLKHFYGVENWDIPAGYLCPPIPGRADYIHYAADLLGSCHQNEIPTGNKIKCLDVGIGANCIYPIIGTKEYGWSFVGSDVELEAIKSARKIIKANSFLEESTELRLQSNSNNIFRGIVKAEEQFDLTICNPPFHSSAEDAKNGTLRKLSNLNRKQITRPTLNFGGRNKELWCEGGEEQFVQNMIEQSREISRSCLWFSTLIAKQIHLKSAYSFLKKAAAAEVRTIPMSQGNKTSRILAWTFLDKDQQQAWVNSRW